MINLVEKMVCVYGCHDCGSLGSQRVIRRTDCLPLVCFIDTENYAVLAFPARFLIYLTVKRRCLKVQHLTPS